MLSENQLVRFKTSFLLHSSRYNLYAEETPVMGHTGAHGKDVTDTKLLEMIENLLISISEGIPENTFITGLFKDRYHPA